MKVYSVYKHIRKRAMIMGLTISLFALMMVSVIASLLIIIFSFSFGVIVGLLVFNALLYGALARWVKKPFEISFGTGFPAVISNKRLSPFSHG
ncbi:hypothetical protein GO009_16735 [Muricauda sp. TY007]|uniref:hypothetical protein n=1 Tax=Allomuricauda sp. TY007 TaxID=2683200 RepID=UPI0013C19033|nr:hypothetical protein [Muricauda sp. TY007]NDV17666.1 hypothetical protein [Muricauda sp. TY007]